MIKFKTITDGFQEAQAIIAERGVAQARHEYSIRLTASPSRWASRKGRIGSDYLKGFSRAISLAEDSIYGMGFPAEDFQHA